MKDSERHGKETSLEACHGNFESLAEQKPHPAETTDVVEFLMRLVHMMS